MVEIIQRYVLSATAGAGSLNCLPIMQARRFRYGLNNNHDHPLTFVENNKNTFHSKKSPKKSLLYWLLGASERGAQDQGHSDVPVMGKRRGGSLAKRGGTCRMVEGLRPSMLWDEVKIRAGCWAISPAPGVLLVGNLTPAGRRRSVALG